MREDLEKSLFKKYPILYSEEDVNSKSLLFNGFNCLDGWYNIIDRLSNTLENLNNIDKRCIHATQIKEKFGILRFYYTHDNTWTDKQFEEVNNIIRRYENMSSHICEKCGSEEGKRISNNGWIMIRCNKCVLSNKIRQVL